MDIEKLMRFKGLTFATLALLGAFLVYLLISTVIQNKAISDTKYASAITQLMDQVSVNLDPQSRQDIASSISNLISGTSVRVAGEDISTKPLKQFLAPIESNADQVVRLISQNNLNDAANAAQSLSATTQKVLSRKLSLLKYMQIAFAVLAVLLYVLLILPTITRLNDKQETNVEVAKESKGIMNTVNEGLFLLDKDQQIGIEQSASLKQMFKSTRDLEGDFFDFISLYVSGRTVQTAREYLGLLYGERVKEKLVKDLNPLNEVEINLVRRDGSYESRYLNFQFNRVIEEEKLSHILVSVTDETKRVLLERELAETKEEQEAQIDLLLSVLHVDRKQLKSFFKTAESDLNQVNNTLEARGHSDAEIRNKISNISNVVHKLKGDAAALGLHKFEFAAHGFEEELAKAKNENETLTGKELLPSLTKLKTLFSELNKMQNIEQKLGDQAGASSLDLETNNEIVSSSVASNYDGVATVLYDLANKVASRNGKRAHLSAYGLSDGDWPQSFGEAQKESLKSIAVQLVRNSVVHGALTPQERLAKGKSDFINIAASLSENGASHVLTIRDDGEGLDNQKIIDRALELELFTEQQLSRLDKNHAFKLIFQPGFTSVEEADLDGGRGIGLDVVYKMIKDLGGTIAVQHSVGRFCQFKVTIPKAGMAS